MGKGLFYVGLAILIFGQGPWFIFGAEHPSNRTELLLFVLALVSFVPGVLLTAVGGLTCIYNFITDRLPY